MRDDEPARDWGENRPQRPQDGRSLPRRQERLEKGLMALDEALDRLTIRVEPVLGPERPSAALSGGRPEDPEMASDLGRFLDGAADRLGMLTGRLSYLTERIDL